MRSGNTTMKLVFAADAMLILILDSGTALQGAMEGVVLCIRNVIPALFPFLLISIYLTGNLAGVQLPFLQPLGRHCRIPRGSEGILLTGLLGGYPTGAQAVAQAYEAGILRRDDAERMLGFCNNAGPAFLFGILSQFFSGLDKLFILWAIHIFSAIFVSMILPGGNCGTVSVQHHKTISLSDSISRAIKTMAAICGWVVFFRMITLFLSRWILWILPDEVNILIAGLLELTNGCISLDGFRDEAIRFLVASLFLNAGGLCVAMQTVSVTGSLGTGMYFPGKGMQCCISTFMCGTILPLLYPGSGVVWITPTALIASVICVYLLRFRKNNSSNLQLQGV